MPALDYNISEVNVYIEHMDEDINDTLNILHEEFPKYKIDVTLPKDISLPKFVNKIYSKNGDVIVIPAQNYQNELDLELFIEKIIKNNPNIAIDNLKTYMKVLQ
jgi:virulence-associated protein VagC